MTTIIIILVILLVAAVTGGIIDTHTKETDSKHHKDVAPKFPKTQEELAPDTYNMQKSQDLFFGTLEDRAVAATQYELMKRSFNENVLRATKGLSDEKTQQLEYCFESIARPLATIGTNAIPCEGKSRMEAELDEIAKLPDNWDGYGAKAPSPQVIENARKVELTIQIKE